MKNSLLLLLLLIFANLGCASLGHKIKRYMNGDETAANKLNPSHRFSENPNMGTPPKRKYSRATRDSLQQEALLDERSGSLWVMEGQGSYLFAQNIVRQIGDSVNVLIEGEPKDQLETKSRVIKNLLQRLEKRAQSAEGGDPNATKTAAAGQPAPGQPGSGQPPAPGQPAAGQPAPGQPTPGQPGAANAAATGNTDPLELDNFNFNVKVVPSRVVERTSDGNYRVKGTQPFMIGKREYKVIVAGVVRADDFDESGVPAGKLLDPSFDVVTQKKGGL